MKKLPFLVLLLFSYLSVFCQEKKIYVFFSPTNLFFNTIKFDIELLSTKKTMHSLIITPFFQIGKTNVLGGAYFKSDNYKGGLTSFSNIDERNDKLLGYGLGIGQKRYLLGDSTNITKHKVYLFYGVYYLHSNIEYTYFTDVLLDNVFTKRVSNTGIDNFDVFGFQTTMGDRIQITNRFMIDIYAGIGIKNTKTNTTAKGHRNYSRSMFDYGYSGINPLLGARFGYKI